MPRQGRKKVDLIEVQERQRPIAAWMKAVMAHKNLTPTGWAVKACLGRDTVSRAIKDNYTHVTSTRTLIELAKAASVPVPLDLGGEAAGTIPTTDVLAAIFQELLTRLVPDRQWAPELFHALGQALRHTLLEEPKSEDHARMAARISLRLQLDRDTE